MVSLIFVCGTCCRGYGKWSICSILDMSTIWSERWIGYDISVSEDEAGAKCTLAII